MANNGFNRDIGPWHETQNVSSQLLALTQDFYADILSGLFHIFGHSIVPFAGSRYHSQRLITIFSP